MLDKPSLYLSDFFERNKLTYYEYLTKVRYEHKLEDWIKFFLKGVIETSEKGIKTFQDIMKLKQEIDNILYSLGKKAENANILMDYLYKNPFINVTIVVDTLKVTKPTATSIIKSLEDNNILKEVTKRQRNKIYIFKKYIDLFN